MLRAIVLRSCQATFSIPVKRDLEINFEEMEELIRECLKVCLLNDNSERKSDETAAMAIRLWWSLQHLNHSVVDSVEGEDAVGSSEVGKRDDMDEYIAKKFHSLLELDHLHVDKTLAKRLIRTVLSAVGHSSTVNLIRELPSSALRGLLPLLIS